MDRHVRGPERHPKIPALPAELFGRSVCLTNEVHRLGMVAASRGNDGTHQHQGPPNRPSATAVFGQLRFQTIDPSYHGRPCVVQSATSPEHLTKGSCSRGRVKRAASHRPGR